MGSEKAQNIAEKLSLSGRVDIYYAFSGEKDIVIFKADGDQDRPNLLGI